MAIRITIIVFLLLLTSFFGCNEEKGVATALPPDEVLDNQNLGNIIIYTSDDEEEKSRTYSKKKTIVTFQDEVIDINITDIFKIEEDDYIVTDVVFFDKKKENQVVLGELTPLNSHLYSYLFYPDTSEDQWLEFELKNLDTEEIEVFTLVVHLADKSNRHNDKKEKDKKNKNALLTQKEHSVQIFADI
ncbi:MAG: hypothetical protein H6621_13225 [Halobacteriovoraceae bacterium]|nr:hypothetical protein [Halobacteriovoraceae bacterium]